jgi:hypothetical protein
VNTYLQQQYAGCQAVIDCNAVSANWGGSLKPALDWMPWEDLQAYARAYPTLVTSYPMVWSCYDDGENGEIWLWPVPSTPGDLEVDAYCIPSDLNSDDDPEAIPGGWRNAIKFGAASLAFMASRRYQEAGAMQQMFEQRIGTARVAADRGKTPSYYQGLG